MADLERFRAAQDAPRDGLATALAELRAGRKRSHWIWYVFPQLAGLGHSSMAVRYGLADLEEADAYLRDPVLGERLKTVAALVRGHLTALRPVRLDALMGSEVDALKVVSCMTLFEAVAKRASETDADPRFAEVAKHATVILTAAGAQGYARCAFTESAVGKAR